MTLAQPVVRGSVSPRLAVPASIPRPHYVDAARGTPWDFDDAMVKDAQTIAAMRVAGRIAADAIVEVGKHIAPGVTTDELDRIGHDFVIAQGAYPSTLGYKGYPKSLCTSVNEVICHGIPDSRALRDGDIVKVDITAFTGGVHGDTCASFSVGAADPEVVALCERTHEALLRAIKAVRPGPPDQRDRAGHRVLRETLRLRRGPRLHRARRRPSFHTDPTILHYDEPRASTVLEPGMTFTIEPMITLGGIDWYMWDDDWTVLTARRLVGRAVGAHPRGHRRRRRDPHPAERSQCLIG